MNGYAYDNYRTQFYMEHSSRIEQHYAHAIEKHPYFCDKVFVEEKDGDFKEEAKEKLYACREVVNTLIANNRISTAWLLRCKFAEAREAYAHGDKAHAVEELYDMIAVCLRTVDVLEGRQELGKPETDS